MLTVYVPSQGPNQIIGADGKKYDARMLSGRLVIDLPPNLFHAQLMGKQGLLWQAENYEAMEFLAKSSNIMINDAFPGAGRPAPTAPPVTAPVIVRLIAPEGVQSISHDGAELKIDKDGSVSVNDQLAAVLRSHGFRDAA